MGGSGLWVGRRVVGLDVLLDGWVVGVEKPIASWYTGSGDGARDKARLGDIPESSCRVIFLVCCLSQRRQLVLDLVFHYRLFELILYRQRVIASMIQPKSLVCLAFHFSSLHQLQDPKQHSVWTASPLCSLERHSAIPALACGCQLRDETGGVCKEVFGSVCKISISHSISLHDLMPAYLSETSRPESGGDYASDSSEDCNTVCFMPPAVGAVER